MNFENTISCLIYLNTKTMEKKERNKSMITSMLIKTTVCHF